MANITINEVSQNYSYNIGRNSFATVALPITASWGPGMFDLTSYGDGLDKEDILDTISWNEFEATQEGLEKFVSTYRGPAANFRTAKDFSYQMAMTLITAGYNVLTCRVCPGAKSTATLVLKAGETTKNLVVNAKYPGTFGNKLQIVLKKIESPKQYFNAIIYVVDDTGVRTAVENLSFVVELDHATDAILHIDEIESKFITFGDHAALADSDTVPTATGTATFTGGTDRATEPEGATAAPIIQDAIDLAKVRYGADSTGAYITALTGLKTGTGALTDVERAKTIKYNEWVYTYAFYVYDLLKDKLSYAPQRIISPGWDDQNICEITDTDIYASRFTEVSPLHVKLMDIAYYSRCATALIDIPKSLQRSKVYDNSESTPGYAQLLSRYAQMNTLEDVNGSLYQTHASLFAPWGHYTYVGTSRQNIASPSFQALMIQRAMILNQTLQYEWALPTNRTHNLKLGKLDYTISKKYLDTWQTLEGVGVNCITEIPGLGTTIWGNSTLMEVPAATYNALANLSTRYLVNAVEDIAYRCGIAITYQYNNNDAYSKFYAGVTPTLDTMKNVGAIEDYYVRMSADINGLDQVNANSVIGKIYLKVNGVINDITVDLIALPPNADLGQYKA